MDLWVKSQNNELLVKVNNALYLEQEENGMWEIRSSCNKEHESSWLVAKYNTKQRALEVLREIDYILDDYDNTTHIYQMPEE